MSLSLCAAARSLSLSVCLPLSLPPLWAKPFGVGDMVGGAGYWRLALSIAATGAPYGPLKHTQGALLAISDVTRTAAPFRFSHVQVDSSLVS